MKMRTAIDSLWPLILVWAVLIGFGFAFNANWHTLRYGPRVDTACIEREAASTDPNIAQCFVGEEDQWLDVALIALIASFLVLLATFILRRMHGSDWLTIAFAAAFTSLACIWFYALGSRMWREWFAEHRDVMLNAVRIGVVICLGWATALFITTRDESVDAE
jgi:hypothetical protein